MGTLVRAHPLARFLSLALSLSWLIEVPLTLTAQGIATFPVPFSWHYLAAFGPLLAALLVTVTFDRGPGLRDLLGRRVRWRIGGGWLLVAVVSPISLFLEAALASRPTRGEWPDLGRLGRINDELRLLAALVGTLFIVRGQPLADPIATLAVATIIAVDAVILFRENASFLLGRSPGDAYLARLEQAAVPSLGCGAYTKCGQSK